MAEKCTNTSSPPSWEMNPKPFASLNHFTVPAATSLLLVAGGEPPNSAARTRRLRPIDGSATPGRVRGTFRERKTPGGRPGASSGGARPQTTEDGRMNGQPGAPVQGQIGVLPRALTARGSRE